MNHIELSSTYGNDKTHALAAWTSTDRQCNKEKEARIPELLEMLAKNGHHTPFEHSQISFLITADIASHIHCLKHRIGVSINTESARYKELHDDKFYIPGDWSDYEQKALTAHCEYCFQQYHDCLERLKQTGVTRQRAKESARYYLPYANQINFVVTFNFRSFMHFQSLRNSESAQLEIKEIAQKMLDLVKEFANFPASLKAFGY